MTAIIASVPVPPGAVAALACVRLLVAFGTKLPTWPLHTWLPDAHVEAPTGGSVILAGVLLKLGGYGLIRFNVQMLPTAAVDLYWLLALVGIISILYGALVCIAQDDLKRLVAFSSVSHMGFVTLGIAAGVYGFSAGGGYGRGAVLGFSGAIFGPLNPKWETMPDLHRFEVAPLAVLTLAFAVFGIVPIVLLDFLSTWSQGILGGL